MRSPSSVPWLAYLCLASSMALVGSYVGLSKVLVGLFPVFLLAWLRFGIAAVAMASWVRKPADEPPLSGRHRRLVFLESFLGNFLFSVCMLWGMQRSSALAAGVIMAALPGVVALLSRLFLGECIQARTLAGIGLAIGGIAWVSWAEHATTASASTTPSSIWGHLLLLCAVFCEASYVVIGKKLTGVLGPRRISSLVNLWGLALVTPLGLWQAMDFDWRAVTPSTWALLLFYALAASMATVWLWMTGLKHVEASRAGVFTVMLPIAAAAVGVWILGEPFSLAQAGAFALALAGLVLATWPGRGTTAVAASPSSDPT